MASERWLQTILLFCIVFYTAVGAFVGINIGTDVTDLTKAIDIIAILKARQITHIRLFYTNTHMLNALLNTGIDVMVGVMNEEIPGIGESPSLAATWINKNIAAYVPSINITAIAVGNEVLTSMPNATPFLVPAMNNLYTALVASNLNHQVKVSSPHSTGIIPSPYPPSTATFNTSLNATIFQMLQFLRNTNSFYMLNVYPYYEYTKSDGIFPLDYALFKPLSLDKQIVDPNALFHYNSMFDALIDSVYNSIAGLNFSGIAVVVTETGWPWLGGTNESDATIDNAETYNNNLIRRVSNGSGPPSQPTIPINAYIYELFNEDMRPEPVSERNWGVLFTNSTAVYDLSLSISDNLDANSSTIFCITKPGANETSLQNGLNWACGPGQANCTAIEQQQPCFFPDTLQNHASYAYNDYYQKMHGFGGTCDFGGTAMTTTIDPSYGLCRFTGSLNSSTGPAPPPPPASGPVSPSSGSSRNLFGTVVALFLLAVNGVNSL